MRDLFSESAFGRATHLISGGKLFGPNDKLTPSTPVEGTPDEDEKGLDADLVDWADNDSEVWLLRYHI